MQDFDIPNPTASSPYTTSLWLHVRVGPPERRCRRLVDGSVRSVRYNVDPTEFMRACVRDDGQTFNIERPVTPAPRRPMRMQTVVWAMACGLAVGCGSASRPRRPTRPACEAAEENAKREGARRGRGPAARGQEGRPGGPQGNHPGGSASPNRPGRSASCGRRSRRRARPSPSARHGRGVDHEPRLVPLPAVRHRGQVRAVRLDQQPVERDVLRHVRGGRRRSCTSPSPRTRRTAPCRGTPRPSRRRR